MLYIFVAEDYPTGTIQIKEEIHLVDMVPLTLYLGKLKTSKLSQRVKEISNRIHGIMII